MKKLGLVALLAALTLGVVACGNPQEPSSQPSEEQSSQVEQSSEEQSSEEEKESVSYTIDFTSLTKKGEEITDPTTVVKGCLGDDAAALVSATATKLYDGNGTGGGLPNTAGFTKWGTGKVAGQLVLNFAEGSQFTKVEIVCHDFYAKSDSFPNNSNKISVNGSTPTLVPYTTDATGETMTFEIAAADTITIDVDLRMLVWSITVSN